MTATERIKSWVDDPVDHAIIFCKDWSPLARGERCYCESCGREISAWPVLIAKTKINSRFHLVCRVNCQAVVTSFGPIPYGGTITKNELPEPLAKFA